MKDQPLFEVDDTTTSYSPPRAVRPRWVDHGRIDAPGQAAGTQVMTQHWFEPDAAAGGATSAHGTPPGAATTPRTDGRPSRSRRAPTTGVVAVALISGVAAVTATIGLLAAGGWLGGPSAKVLPSLPPSSEPSLRSIVAEPPDMGRIAAEVGPSVVTVVVGPPSDDPATAPMDQAGAGVVVASGIVYTVDGLILTNRHVVCGEGTVVVVLSDGRQVAAQVYGLDSLTDLAIIRVAADGLTVADIGDSASVRPGQRSAVIGSSAESLATTVSGGVVRALGRELMVSDPCLDGERLALRDIIQTDVEATEVTTGGPLVNAAGAVIGLSTSLAGGGTGTSYAIPIDLAKPIMEQAIDDKPLSRPWMGITYTALDAQVAVANGLRIDHGAWLRGSADGSLPAVIPDGPADLAGLEAGDILTAIDGQRIDSTHSLDDILSQYRPESQDPVEVALLRGGVPLELPVTLGIRTDGG